MPSRHLSTRLASLGAAILLVTGVAVPELRAQETEARGQLQAICGGPLNEFSARDWPSRREALLASRGGVDRDRASMAAMLSWLLRHGIPANGNPAALERCACVADPGCDPVRATALSALCLMAMGSTNRSGPYVVQTAPLLKSLRHHLAASGSDEPGARARTDRILATLALVEAYGMTKSGVWKQPALDAMALLPGLLASPSSEPESTLDREESAASLAFAAIALRAAHAGRLGIAAPVLDSVRQRARGILDRIGPADTDSLEWLAAAMARCWIDGDLAIRAMQAHPAWRQRVGREEPKFFEGDDALGVHLATLMAFAIRGEEWWSCTKPLSIRMVPPSQDSPCAAGSMPAQDETAFATSRHETTALALLTLTTFFRYDLEDRLFHSPVTPSP